MNIGITGSGGFIGWHLRCFLKTLADVKLVKCIGRKGFSEKAQLESFVSDLDCIIHLAGVNRSVNEDLKTGNVKPAEQLVEALEALSISPCVIYASSTHANSAKTDYGVGKANAGVVLKKWADHNEAKLISMSIPHVYGEYGKPFYNSAIATFCHQIVKGETPTINESGVLEIVHVQDLVEFFIGAYRDGKSGEIRVPGHKVKVVEVVDRIKNLHKEYIGNNRIPDLSCARTRSLFNTLRGAISHERRPLLSKVYTDERGWLTETVKAGSKGQCFVSSTKPGITRGNHFHRRKVERFFVLKGKGKVKIRKLFSDEIISFDLDGAISSYVDIPTLHTHSITNVGNDELITLFWTDEYYDPESPDTYFENVTLD